MVCPFDPAVCGKDSTLALGDDGSLFTVRQAEVDDPDDFVFGQVCSYDFTWPVTATSGDQIVVTVSELPEQATLTAILSKDGQLGHIVRTVTSNSRLRVEYPN